MKLKITKYQYQDFAMLLHSFNSLILAARYRKYKVKIIKGFSLFVLSVGWGLIAQFYPQAKQGLEGVPNYSGRLRQLWRFAIEAVLEEEVRPQLRSWSFRCV